MDWTKVKSAIGQIAPWLAGTLGSPVAGVAVKGLCDALGLDGAAANPDAMTAAIAGATPEQLQAIHAADLKHAEFMQQLGYQYASQIALATVNDRDGARKREMAVKDHIPAVLAAIAVAGFVGLVVLVICGFAPAEAMRDGFWMLAGAAIATYKDVYGYYFGSSAGSHSKDATIADLTKADGGM